MNTDTRKLTNYAFQGVGARIKSVSALAIHLLRCLAKADDHFIGQTSTLKGGVSHFLRRFLASTTPSVFSRFGAVFLGFRWLLAVGGFLFLGIFSTLSAQKVVYLDKTTFKLKNWDSTVDVVLNRGVNELEYRYTPQDEIGSLLGRTKAFLSQDFVDETAFNLFLTEYEEVKSQHLDDENFVRFVDALVVAGQKSVVLETSSPKKTAAKPALKEKPKVEKIGRASCRERV